MRASSSDRLPAVFTRRRGRARPRVATLAFAAASSGRARATSWGS